MKTILHFHRRQEKEQRQKEKEAKRIEEKATKRHEKEAAKLEKMYRNTISSRSALSRSSERVGGGGSRSGSLERRRSGDGEMVVLNQSTVHGIASPNRRPTIFDVFRPRTKSDAKKKERDVGKQFGSDRDNSSGGSGSAHGGSGGIMQSMKTAVQNTIGGHGSGHHHKHGTTGAAASGTSSSVSKFRDGSAHPHAGSDAQVCC